MPERMLAGFDLAARRKSIEVGDRPIKAVIIRDGEEIRTPPVDERRIDDFIDRLKPIDRQATPRLVQQSVPAGTFVAPGTPVDLVFVRPTDITIGILEGAHTGMRTKTVEEILSVIEGDRQLQEIVKKGQPEKLTEAERARVKGALEEQGIEIDDSQPDRTLDKAFETIVHVRAFE